MAKKLLFLALALALVFSLATGASARYWNSDVTWEGGYAYNSDGELITDDIISDGNDNWYYVNNDGMKVTQDGWVQSTHPYTDKPVSLYIENGFVVFGWKEIGGIQYYFDDYYGYMMSGESFYANHPTEDTYGHFYAKEDGQVVFTPNIWVESVDEYENSYWYFTSENGSLVTGWKLLGNSWYYFDSSGLMMTGAFPVWNADTEKEDYYYAEASGRVLTNGNRWYQDEDKHWYWLGEGGKLATGVYQVGNTTYCFDRWGCLGNGPTYMGYDQEAHKELYILADQNGLALNKPNSWQQYRNDWYFTDANGYLVQGLQVINGHSYYFDHEMQTGIFSAWDSELRTYVDYYAQDSGILVFNGWFSDGSDWYFLKDGAALTEWQKINNNWYYFSRWGRMRTGIFQTDDGLRWLAQDSGVVTLTPNRWISNARGEFYHTNSDGSLKYNGRYTIGESDYFFDYDCIMQTGLYRGYLIADSGAIITTEGWQLHKGRWVYVTEGGELVTDTKRTIGLTEYAFDSSGYLADGPTEYWDEETGTYVWGLYEEGISISKPGWNLYEDDWYYFGEDGMVVDQMVTIGASDFYFNYYGHMATGRFYYNYWDDELGYYVDSYYFAYDNGAIAKNTWVVDGFNTYYATEDGTLATGWKLFGNSWFHFGSNGCMTIGTVWDDEYDDWFAFDDNGYSMGSIGAAGWTLVDGQWYFYPNAGEAYTGWLGNYYIKDNQMCYNGKISVYNESTDEYDLFVLDKNGFCVKNGWAKVNGNWYYADAYGYLAAGWKLIGSTWYYFDSGSSYMYEDTVAGIYDADSGNYQYCEFAEGGAFVGYLPEEGWYKTRYGKWYYDGYSYGWQTIDGVQYYFEGYMETNTTAYLNGSYVWLDANGRVDNGSGWRKSEYGSWYYLENGALADGWRTIGGKEYYFSYGMATGPEYIENEETGEYEFFFFAATGEKISVPENGWYAYTTDVEMYNGTQKYTYWLYFQDGEPIESGWHTIGGTKYYFTGSGVMANGPINLSYGEHIYVFNEAGQLVKNQWYLFNGTWYYANAYGRALTGTHIINGITYVFDHYGQLI